MRIAECVTAVGKQSLITLYYLTPTIHKYPLIYIPSAALTLTCLSYCTPRWTWTTWVSTAATATAHRSTVTDNTYQLGGADDERERAQNAAIIEELERKKRLRKLAVPTDDKKVRERLRAYGEPITLFGEGVSSPSLGQRTQKTNTDRNDN